MITLEPIPPEVELSLEERLNNKASFFGPDGNPVAPKVTDAFLQGTWKKGNFEDHVNFHLAKGAYLGALQTESGGMQGTPPAFLVGMSDVGILAHYFGIQFLKDSLLPRRLDTLELSDFTVPERGKLLVERQNQAITIGGMPADERIQEIVGIGYKIEAKGGANALRTLHNNNTGFPAQRRGTHAELFHSLTPQEQMWLFQSIYSQTTSTQERKADFEFFDEVYASQKRRNEDPIDSKLTRQRYALLFRDIIRAKFQRELKKGYAHEGRTGVFVPSEKTPGRIYFVQQQKAGSTNYFCSCEHGLRKTYGRYAQGEECKHISERRKYDISKRR